MTRLVLFTGKGGVGKSTTSAATALKQASLGKRVLLMSSDPAHNLGDLFETQLSNDPKPITENLWAVEMDATKRALEFMNSVNEIFKSMFIKSIRLKNFSCFLNIYSIYYFTFRSCLICN